MEEKDDLMNLFDDGMELDFSSNNLYNPDDTEDQDDENIDNTIDDENQENVNSEDDDTNEEEEDSSDSSPNLFSSVAEVLFEQGLLPSLESSKNVKSIDDLTEVVKKEIDIQASLKVEEYINKVDINKIAASRKEIESLDSIDENFLKENIEVAKELIYNDYINQGLSEERAKKLLRKTIDLGEDMLIEEALESKQSLKEYNIRLQEQEAQEAAKQLEREKQEQQKIQEDIKKLVFESKDLIKGLPVNKALQNKVYKAMNEVVSKNPTTGELENEFIKDRNTNPIEFDTRMYYLYVMTNGFRDLSLVSKQVKSSAVKDLEKAIRQTKIEDSSLPSYITDPQSYDSPFGSELVL